MKIIQEELLLHIEKRPQRWSWSGQPLGSSHCGVKRKNREMFKDNWKLSCFALLKQLPKQNKSINYRGLQRRMHKLLLGSVEWNIKNNCLKKMNISPVKIAIIAFTKISEHSLRVAYYFCLFWSVVVCSKKWSKSLKRRYSGTQGGRSVYANKNQLVFSENSSYLEGKTYLIFAQIWFAGNFWKKDENNIFL